MKKRKKTSSDEPDSMFLLKIVLYVVLGSFWVGLNQSIEPLGIPISAVPVGLLIGLVVASRDKFQIDRKIEYVVLIIMTVITFFLPSAIYI